MIITFSEMYCSTCDCSSHVAVPWKSQLSTLLLLLLFLFLLLLRNTCEAHRIL